MKIFQIGFNRCGTRTLHEYLRANGIRSIHWDKGQLAKRMFENLRSGKAILSGYEKHDAFTDMEWLGPNRFLEGYKLYPQLANGYPDAVFILNTRNRDGWIASRFSHGRGSYAAKHKKLLGLSSDEELAMHWQTEWETHHSNVIEYFSTKAHRFFVCDIETDLPDLLSWRLPEYGFNTALYAPRGMRCHTPLKRTALNPITSVTLCVCTYRRPELFKRFAVSAAQLIVPTGVTFHLVVADNNVTSHYELYIKGLLEKLPFPSSYGHEPAPGYANARNKALELALKTPSQLIAFVDDDYVLDPFWLSGHLRSHEEFACDVAAGAIGGRSSRFATGRRFDHGEQRPTTGTSNVSFKRWIVADDGIGLRFDLRFNVTGQEDKDFFSRAHMRGATIVVSKYPLAYETVAVGNEVYVDSYNKADVTSIMQRNKIVRLRCEHGYLIAIAAAIWGSRYGLKSAFVYLDHWMSRIFIASDRAAQKRLSAYKNVQKMIQGFKGLSGDYVTRGEIRRSL